MRRTTPNVILPRIVRPLPLLLSLLLASPLAAAPAAIGAASISNVKLGLGGRFKLGHWSPVWIQLNAADEPLRGDLHVEVPDGDDLWSSYVGGGFADVDVPAGEQRTVLGYVRVGRAGGSMIVRFDSRDGPALSQVHSLEQFGLAITTSSQRVVVVGDNIGMDQAQRYLRRRDGEEVVATLIEDTAGLPDRWYGYDGVNLLVLTTSRPDLYEELTPAQRAAIVTWVELGGRVMMTVGAQGEQALADGGLLAQLAPGAWQRTMPLRETSALEKLAESSIRLDQSTGGESAQDVMLTTLSNPRGQILLAATNNRPLIIEDVRGFGHVIFVGIDLDRQPIAGWKERGRVVARVLEFALQESEPADDSHRGGETTQLGFEDITGQLRASLDQFTGVRLVPFSLIAGLMIVYILLIGPGDYFLLKKVVRRMELTWLTFAVTAAAFAGLAWWLASLARSDQMLVNQVDVVDIDLDAALVRGTSWLRLYSPANGKLNLSLQPAIEAGELAQSPGMLFGWQGLPGKGLGGMDDNSRLTVGGPSYEIDNISPPGEPSQMEVKSLPVAHQRDERAVRPLVVQAELDADYELQSNRSKLLNGNVVNPLPVRLTGCVLYHDRWAYNLGTLEPGQQKPVNDDLNYLNVKWMLTERTVVEGDQRTDLWDHAMRDDVPKLMRMMMFHEAAGGRAHTALVHRYHGFIDLSRHLAADRAILVGRAEAPATTLIADGQPHSSDGDKHWTFYRIMFKTTAAE